jgi:hypothetical protein
MNNKLPDLSRTIAALKRYDEKLPQLLQLMDLAASEEGVRLVELKIEALGRLVGEAYGLDTADRNNPETCASTVRPGPAVPGVGQELSFVRRMVALSLKA